MNVKIVTFGGNEFVSDLGALPDKWKDASNDDLMKIVTEILELKSTYIITLDGRNIIIPTRCIDYIELMEGTCQKT